MGGRRRWTAADGPRRGPPGGPAGGVAGLPAGAAGAAGPLPMVRAVSHRWPRLDGYLAYLRISRQRRPAGWWCAAAARAGLLTIPSVTGPAEHSSLRLFTFQRPGGIGASG